MSYDTLRKNAFSHRMVGAASLTMMLLLIGSAGILVAEPARGLTVRNDLRYQLNFSMNKTEEGQIAVRVRVMDTVTKQLFGESRVTTTPGAAPSVMRFGNSEGADDREGAVTLESRADGSGTMKLAVTRNGVIEQLNDVEFPPPGLQVASKYSGEPISLRLANAEIKDVLRVFGSLTGNDIEVAPDVTGSVNVQFTNVPWDQALEEVLAENGLGYRLEGKKIVVFKK